MTTVKRKRSNYTEDFKRDAVALVTQQGYKISEAARSLDIGANLVGRWPREFEDEVSGVRLSGEECEELKRLRKENRQLRMDGGRFLVRGLQRVKAEMALAVTDYNMTRAIIVLGTKRLCQALAI
jgi:transposase